MHCTLHPVPHPPSKFYTDIIVIGLGFRIEWHFDPDNTHSF
jgi:hypothetical protein